MHQTEKRVGFWGKGGRGVQRFFGPSKPQYKYAAARRLPWRRKMLATAVGQSATASCRWLGAIAINPPLAVNCRVSAACQFTRVRVACRLAFHFCYRVLLVRGR